MNFITPSNPVFVLARSGKRLPHIVVAIVMGFVFIIVGVVVGGGLSEVLLRLLFPNGSASLPNSPVVTALVQSIQLILSFGLIIVVIALWMRFVEKRTFATVGFMRPGALLKYARGAGVALIMFGGAVGISALLGYIAPEPGDPANEGLFALGGVLVALLGWVVQGAGEEVLARGWQMPVIGARYRPWIGIVISSVVFAILHGLNPNLSAIAIVNLFLFAIFAAFYALREGGLWGICALHSVWNWAQGNLFGLQVSGANTAGGTLLNLMETGPDAITGGPFGPEGGLAVTAVLIIGCAVTCFWRVSTANALDASVVQRT